MWLSPMHNIDKNTLQIAYGHAITVTEQRHINVVTETKYLQKCICMKCVENYSLGVKIYIL